MPIEITDKLVEEISPYVDVAVDHIIKARAQMSDIEAILGDCYQCMEDYLQHLADGQKSNHYGVSASRIKGLLMFLQAADEAEDAREKYADEIKAAEAKQMRCDTCQDDNGEICTMTSRWHRTCWKEALA